MHNFRDTASVGIIIYDEFDAKNMGRLRKTWEDCCILTVY